MRRRAGLLVALPLGVGVAFGACQTPTSIVVAVSTTVDCSAYLEREVHVVAGTPGSVKDSLDAASTKSCKKAGELGEVVLLPSDDDGALIAFKVILGVGRPTGDCGVTDTGGPDGVWADCIVARRRLRFLEGEELHIAVPLQDDCIGVACSETTTCVDGGCVDAEVELEDCVEASCGGDEVLLASSSSGGDVSSGGDGGASGEGGGKSSTSVVTGGGAPSASISSGSLSTTDASSSATTSGATTSSATTSSATTSGATTSSATTSSATTSSATTSGATTSSATTSSATTTSTGFPTTSSTSSPAGSPSSTFGAGDPFEGGDGGASGW